MVNLVSTIAGEYLPVPRSYMRLHLVYLACLMCYALQMGCPMHVFFHYFLSLWFIASNGGGHRTCEAVLAVSGSPSSQF